MLVPALLAASWLALPASPDYADAMPDMLKASVNVGCEIRASRSDSGTRLDAVITASGAVSGNYSFRVEPAAGGAPVIDEQSDFAIDGTGPSEVRKAGVDLPAGEGYRASLSIEWPNGTSSCSAAAS